jgi:phage tail sheath protein FI
VASTSTVTAQRDLLAFLVAQNVVSGATDDTTTAGRGPGAFLQLVHPWVRTLGSMNLPGGVESPDGVLSGVLARSALRQGAFLSAAGEAVSDVFDTIPQLGPADTAPTAPDGTLRLIDRVSRVGRTPDGFELLSDVTCDPDSYRQASTSRLVSAIVRAARQIGETVAFEPSSERTWATVVRGMQYFLDRFTDLGAIRSDQPYSVRCDRTTMTQADIDAGRVIAEVGFVASMSIDSISIVLALTQGTGSSTGGVS